MKGRKFWLGITEWTRIANRMHKMKKVVREDYKDDGTLVREVDETDDLGEAKLLGSVVKRNHDPEWNTHILALDIDHHAALVPSSTPGHFHLYIEHDMFWYQYERVLLALAQAGIIEPGYYEVSKRRKETHLRVPWVSKHAKEDDE